MSSARSSGSIRTFRFTGTTTIHSMFWPAGVRWTTAMTLAITLARLELA
ncbi:hypothetical protein LJR098_005724 [Rhizobium sp. LjRoot98]